MQDRRLCNEIECMMKRQMVTAADFQWLADQIREQQNETVGVNTLKRMWGFKGYADVEPQQGTLNVLASFLGYSSYKVFCSKNGEPTSDRILVQHIDTKRLAKGLFIRLSWLPDRVCIIKHLGDSHFVVQEVKNSKLSVGDTFECRFIMQNEPVYLMNLEHNGNPPIAYIAGKQRGVRFEVIED